MKLDKILALIRLANNNPSEGEANAAARKVCREITKQQIEQVQPKTAAGKMNEAVFKEWIDPRTGDMNIKITGLDIHGSKHDKIVNILKVLKEAIQKPTTWNDVRRTTEPGFKSKVWDYGPSQSQEDFFKEFFRKYGVDFGGFKTAPTDDDWTRATNARQEEEKQRNEEKAKRHASYYGFKPSDDYEVPFTMNFKGGRRAGKQQEMRTCAKCGVELMTFRIKENPWVCQACHWNWGASKT